MILLAMACCALPTAFGATPDRTTIPGRSASEALAQPRQMTRPEPVLPAYDFTPARPSEKLAARERYPVRDVRLSGASEFMLAPLREISASFEGRELSFRNMLDLRDRLTARYVDEGYVTSGAVLDTLDDGVLHIRIVEGRLAEIRVQSTGRFRSRYVADYLAGFGATEPVNVLDLEQRLQILQQQPQVSQVEAQLLPGERPGDSVLHVSPLESRAVGLGLEASNQVIPALGGVQGVASVNLLNLTGRADDLSFGARGAEGLLEFMGEYDFPLGAGGSRLAAYAFGADSNIVREPFKQLDIGAESVTAGLRLRHPLRRTAATQVHLTLNGEWRQSKTYLLGNGFSFIEGPEEGRARMTILRGGVEALRRTARDVIYGRLEVSVGIDALGATISTVPDVADGRFAKFRAQLQWARRLPWLNSQGLIRLDGQFANDPMFGLEQYPIGGRWTVRGYRENTLIRDNAAIASAEWRVPLRRDATGRSQLELRPFADWARSGNVNGGEIGPTTLASVGLGVYFSPLPPLAMELYWGEALNEVEYAGEYDLQDDGIHFRFTWDASR